MSKILKVYHHGRKRWHTFRSSKNFRLFVIVILLITLPLVVILAQQVQDIRKRAGGPATPATPPGPAHTQFHLTLFLHGLGKAGDSLLPGAIGNMSPLRPQRFAIIRFFDEDNYFVTGTSGAVVFNPQDGSFSGTLDAGTVLPSGVYLVKVQVYQYLHKQLPGIARITNGYIHTLPTISLVTGDANSDNRLNIIDYTLLVDCYSDLGAPKNCDAGKKLVTDHTDDGAVNQFDLNLLLRELSVRIGD